MMILILQEKLEEAKEREEEGGRDNVIQVIYSYNFYNSSAVVINMIIRCNAIKFLEINTK